MLYGEEIREARKDKKITQLELSKLIHINQHSISEWERSIRPIPDYILPEINKVLDLDLRPRGIAGRFKEKAERFMLIQDAFPPSDDQYRAGFFRAMKIAIEIVEDMEKEYACVPLVKVQKRRYGRKN